MNCDPKIVNSKATNAEVLITEIHVLRRVNTNTRAHTHTHACKLQFYIFVWIEKKIVCACLAVFSTVQSYTDRISIQGVWQVFHVFIQLAGSILRLRALVQCNSHRRRPGTPTTPPPPPLTHSPSDTWRLTDCRRSYVRTYEYITSWITAINSNQFCKLTPRRLIKPYLHV